MNNDKSEFDLIEFQGKLYPVVLRKKGNSKINACPYCNYEHSHGILSTEGPTLPHCLEKRYFEEIIINGKTIPQTRGYYIKEY
jgi:hypothetical protein